MPTRQGDLFEARRWKARQYRGRYRLEAARETEDRVHEAIVALMERSGLAYGEECVWYHPFNEIPLEDGDWKLAKRKGLKPGLFDLYFERAADELSRERPTVRIWLEFKRDEKQPLSQWQQRIYRFYVKTARVPVYRVTTYARGFTLLRDHGFLRPGCV